MKKKHLQLLEHKLRIESMCDNLKSPPCASLRLIQSHADFCSHIITISLDNVEFLTPPEEQAERRNFLNSVGARQRERKGRPCGAFGGFTWHRVAAGRDETFTVWLSIPKPADFHGFRRSHGSTRQRERSVSCNVQVLWLQRECWQTLKKPEQSTKSSK